MVVKLRKALVVALLPLAGCTTTEQANKVLESRFQGSSTDAFFLAYGPPSSSFRMNDGRILYSWQERDKTNDRSITVNTTVVGNQTFSTVTPDSSADAQCEVKILAEPNGKIARIDVASDSLGDWQLSRCNEIFGKR